MYHVLSEKERTSQFLIGKVEQEAGLSPKGEFYMWVLKSQFLIGKV